MSSARSTLLQKKPDDIVIVSAVRTAITMGRKGGFKDTCPEELLVAVFDEVVKRGKVTKDQVDEIQVGNVLPPGGGATVARMAQLAAGFPVTSTVATLNRQCSSGLTAVDAIAAQLAIGQIEIGIGAGVESMTLGYGAGVMPEKFSELVLGCQEAEDCLLPMGITSENVAAKYNITRKQQDIFAASSFAKATAAQKAGHFKEEIVPVTVTQVDAKTGDEKRVTVEQDDGIRAGTTFETLSKLKPAFSKDGATTAGNASQVSDGAAAVLLTKRSTATKLGLPILGKYGGSAVAGVEPALMGIGPAFAIPKLLKRAGLDKNDIDFWEINEAFASQAVMSVQTLGIPFEKVNPVGGAIAFGHPLGCTGARQIATGFSQAKRTGDKVFVTSMCIGSGMGMAAVFVNEQ